MAFSKVNARRLGFLPFNFRDMRCRTFAATFYNHSFDAGEGCTFQRLVALALAEARASSNPSKCKGMATLALAV
jgi:hypothetical protein